MILKVLFPLLVLQFQGAVSSGPWDWLKSRRADLPSNDTTSFDLQLRCVKNNTLNLEKLRDALRSKEHTNLFREGFVFNKVNNFTCPTLKRSMVRPTSVHKLRPGDIDIVAAMGDSLSAGTGLDAVTILGDKDSYRGGVFSIGGYYKATPLSISTNEDVDQHFTVPNALKRYNPYIKGFASGIEGAGVNEDQYKSARLDMAVPGSKAINMTEQARNLIKELMINPLYDYQNDWKLLTLFIGGNNLCQYCVDPRSTPQGYVADIKEALDILHKNVPRMFVNLLTIFNIDQVVVIGKDDKACSLAHQCFCPCGLLMKNSDQLALQVYNGLYRGLIWDMILSNRYNTRDDFTVVIQPFFEQTTTPLTSDGQVDMSYFAPDCFHFSKKGHNYAGKGLWNNMFQKYGEKDRVWFTEDKIVCPTEQNPYLYTAKNSQ